jgi:predicted amidohydrolase
MWRYLLFGILLALVTQTNAEHACSAEAKYAGSQPAIHLRVAAVQMRSTRDLDANVRKIDEYLSRCAKDGVKVAVFPECALTGYFDDAYMQGFSAKQLQSAQRKVAEACRAHGIYAVVGTPHRDGDRLYNSAAVITPKGEVLARYHKVQLAESWPAAGDELVVFKIDGVVASIIICHDERYPELVRLPVLAGRALFFVCHMNRGWPTSQSSFPIVPRFRLAQSKIPCMSSNPTRRRTRMPRARTAKAG